MALTGWLLYKSVAKRNPDAPVVAPPRSLAVLSNKVHKAPTQRDRHLQQITKHGRMEWRKATGYQARALVEADISRFKRVIGSSLLSHKDPRRLTEVRIAAGALNRMLQLGRPSYCSDPFTPFAAPITSFLFMHRFSKPRLPTPFGSMHYVRIV